MQKNLLPYILSILCLLSCIKEKQKGVDLAIGDRIPSFSVTMNDGTVVIGEELSHGVSCIVFFTTVCPDCRQTLPHVQSVYNEFSEKGVKFALISREEGFESIQTYWSEHNFTMPYSAQTDRKIYELFAQTRVPRIYICKNGLIRAIFTDNPNPVYEDIVQVLNDL